MSKAIVEIAQKILDGVVDPLEGCREIVTSQGDLTEEQRHDEDLLTIAGIESETDDLPTPRSRHLWDPIALAKKDKEREAYLVRNRQYIWAACAALIKKWK